MDEEDKRVKTDTYIVKFRHPTLHEQECTLEAEGHERFIPVLKVARDNLAFSVERRELFCEISELIRLYAFHGYGDSMEVRHCYNDDMWRKADLHDDKNIEEKRGVDYQIMAK